MRLGVLLDDHVAVVALDDILDRGRLVAREKDEPPRVLALADGTRRVAAEIAKALSAADPRPRRTARANLRSVPLWHVRGINVASDV